MFHNLTVEEDEQRTLALFRHKASEPSAGGVVVIHLQVLLDHASRLNRRIRQSTRRRSGSRERRLALALLLHLHRHANGVSSVIVRRCLRRQVGRTFIRAALFKRTHHQRVPRGAGVLLDQERGPERLAEESLTLLRDVVRGVSATRLQQLRGRHVVLCSGRGRARRRRW